MSLAEIENKQSYGRILEEDELFVDIDSEKESEKLLEIIKNENIGTRVYKTSRGMHFSFKNPYNVKNAIHSNTPIGVSVDIKTGNAMEVRNIPEGTFIHNVELQPGKGGQMARSAGSGVQILGIEGKYALLRLSSGEVRKVLSTCRAVIGEVGNEDHELVNLGKAGRKRHMGIRPTVRGSVMNPNDHPHGGGEGRAPIGRSGPMTPWGKPALGLKTRKNKKESNKYIVTRRKK